MFNAIDKTTGEVKEVYAVENNCFLVDTNGAFLWVGKENYRPVNVSDVPKEIATPEKTGTDTYDSLLTIRSCHNYDLAAIINGLKSGDLEMFVGDSFTTRLKSGQEVEFVCTDKDNLSYRFESRDCLGRYTSAKEMKKYLDWVLSELPDVLRDQIMEIKRQYKTSDGEIKEYVCRLFWPSASEIFPPDECYGDQGVYEQLEWYKDLHNRVRAYEKGGAADWYWTQSPHSGNTTYWCGVSNHGNAADYNASDTNIAAPVCFRIPRI